MKVNIISIQSFLKFLAGILGRPEHEQFPSRFNSNFQFKMKSGFVLLIRPLVSDSQFISKCNNRKNFLLL